MKKEAKLDSCFHLLSHHRHNQNKLDNELVMILMCNVLIIVVQRLSTISLHVTTLDKLLTYMFF